MTEVAAPLALRRLAAGGSWNAAGQLVPVAIGIVLTPYVVHHLGVERYGVFALALAIGTFLTSFDGGLSASAGRYFSVFAAQDDRRTTGRYVVSLALSLALLTAVLSLGLWVLADPVVHLFGVPPDLRSQTRFVLEVLGPFVGASLLRNVLAAVLAARQRFAWTSSTQVLGFALYALGVVVLLHRGDGLRGLALLIVAQAVLGFLLLLPPVLPLLSLEQGWLLSRAEARDFTAYAGKVQVVGLTALVNLQADSLIIGAVLGVRPVGLYNAGAAFATQLRSVPLNGLPPIATSLAQNPDRAEFARLQRVWVRATAGWSVAGAAAAGFGVQHWLGPAFRDSAIVAAVLLVGHGVNLLTGPLTSYLQAIGRPDVEARYGLVGMLLNVALTIPMVFAFGLIGVVVATSVGQVIGSLYLLRLVRQRVDASLPTFLADLPVLPLAGLALAVVAAEVVLSPFVAGGALGLLACAVPAAVGLAGYAASVLRSE